MSEAHKAAAFDYYKALAAGNCSDHSMYYKKVIVKLPRADWRDSPDLFLEIAMLLKLAIYFKKEKESFEGMKKACKQVLAEDPNLNTLGEYKKNVQECLKLLNKEVGNIEQSGTRLKLEDVAKDKIGTDTKGFVERRIAAAKAVEQDFYTDINKIYLAKANELKMSIVGLVRLSNNTKNVPRTMAKIDEMEQVGGSKYPKPVANYCYDLIRGRMEINPVSFEKDKVVPQASFQEIKEIAQWLKLILKELGSKHQMFQVKNKLDTLANITLNFVYKGLIAELQICIGTSHDNHKTHSVYDFERLTDFNALHDYIGEKARVGLNNFSTSFVKDQKFPLYEVTTQQGSADYVPLMIHMLSSSWENHSYTTMPTTLKGDYITKSREKKLKEQEERLGGRSACCNIF